MAEPALTDGEQKRRSEPGDDLGYVLGWFCGVIFIVGVIVAAVNLSQGHRRKALQAMVLPAAVILWISLIIDGLSPLLPDTEAGAATWLLILAGGILFIPILGLRFLRGLNWPRGVRTSEQ